MNALEVALEEFLNHVNKICNLFVSGQITKNQLSEIDDLAVIYASWKFGTWSGR